MSLRGRPLLNAGQVQDAGLREASLAISLRGLDGDGRPICGHTPRGGPPSSPSHSFMTRSERREGREARLRRLGKNAVTLRAEDPGPCARRETKATTKEVAAAGGGGGSFLSNRSAQPREKGDSSWPWGAQGGGCL